MKEVKFDKKTEEEVLGRHMIRGHASQADLRGMFGKTATGNKITKQEE